MRNMAEPNAEANAGKSSRTWERNSTRQAILDAARRLAAQDGAETITLSRVAAEAGFAPPAVYAYFVSKDDLHLAVVADDLEKLARVMRGEDLTQPGEAPPADDGAGAEGTHAADVIAFAPARDADVEGSPDVDGELFPGEAVAETEVTGEAARADVPDSAEGPEEAEEAGFAEPEFDLAGDEPDAEGETPAPDAATSEVSLAEIEQALGVVLAAHDFADDAVEEEVPNAFPEETPLETADDTVDEVPADDTVTPGEPAGSAALEPGTEAEPQGLRARFRRSRREAAEAQMAMPLADSAQPSAEAAPTDLAQMAVAIAQLQETVVRLEARPVDSWLERRLRVFERTLADIEARMEKTERDSMTALSTVSEGFKALDSRFGGTHEETERRAAENEQRHRAVAADLRQYVRDLAGRLSAVETSLSRTLGEAAGSFGLRDSAPVLDENLPAPAAEPAAEVEAGNTVRGEGESYLSAARRAAKSAAAKAEIQRSRSPLSYLAIEPAAAKRIALSRRTLQLVAGVLILIVALIAANMVLRSRTASAPSSPVVATPKVVQSPDARVAAMAKAGNAQAELVAALKLLNGDGVATDVPSAAHWLRKAADQHQPVAQYWLGTLYERGRGVALDRAKAMKWYAQAAAAGNAKAMYRLGVGDAEGWNGEANYAEAAKWFGKAAELGIIDAQFNLAVLYERGSGVSQNLGEAFKWYAIAAAQGDSQSKARIDALASQMQPQDVEAAQAAAGKFEPRQPDPGANVEPTVAQVAATP